MLRRLDQPDGRHDTRPAPGPREDGHAAEEHEGLPARHPRHEQHRVRGMRSRAGVLFEAPGKWEIVEVEVDPPKASEVLVKYHFAGLCHSDDHVATGDAPVGYYPFCGGHEGSGEIVAVGEGVYDLEPGDHFVASFIPGCGTCTWCARGKGNLCDNGAFMLLGTQLDSTFRLHLDDGTDVG